MKPFGPLAWTLLIMIVKQLIISSEMFRISFHLFNKSKSKGE